MSHKQLGVLVEGAVVRVWVDDQLRVWQRLLEHKRIVCRDDPIVTALHYQCRLTDGLEVIEAAVDFLVSQVLAYRHQLSVDGLLAYERIAIPAAQLALEERETRGLAGL